MFLSNGVGKGGRGGGEEELGTELKALGEDLHFRTKNGHFVVQFLDLLCLGTSLMVIFFLSSSIFFMLN